MRQIRRGMTSGQVSVGIPVSVDIQAYLGILASLDIPVCLATRVRASPVIQGWGCRVIPGRREPADTPAFRATRVYLVTPAFLGTPVSRVIRGVA